MHRSTKVARRADGKTVEGWEAGSAYRVKRRYDASVTLRCSDET